MTLKEAIKTGKPFKRMHWTGPFQWYLPFGQSYLLPVEWKGEPREGAIVYRLDDILSDDWQVKNEAQ